MKTIDIEGKLGRGESEEGLREKSFLISSTEDHPSIGVHRKYSFKDLEAILVVSEDIPEELKPFLGWVHRVVLEPPKISTWTDLAGYMGFIIGSLGTFSVYPLSGAFGDIVSNFFKINDPRTKEAIYHFFGVNSTIPMVALAGNATKNHFRSFFVSNPYTKAVVKNEHGDLKQVFKGIAYFLGCLAAAIPSYITYEVFDSLPPWARWMFSISAYIGGFMFKVDAEMRVIDRVFNSLTHEEAEAIKNIRSGLVRRMQTAVTKVKQLSDTEVEELFNKFFEEIAIGALGDDADADTILKLRHVFQCATSASDIAEQETYHSRWGRKLFGFVGFILGGVSGYTYYVFGEWLALSLCEWLGINDPEKKEVIANIFASLAVIPWGVLGAEATQARFEQMFDAWFIHGCHTPSTKETCQGLRSGIKAFSVFEGILSAIPPTYLAIEATAELPMSARLMLIIPTFLGIACVRTRAVDVVFNQGVDSWVSSYANKTPAYKREKLGEGFRAISNGISKLPDKRLVGFFKHVASEDEEAAKLLIGQTDENTPLTLGQMSKQEGGI